jgi:hypothetical protein
MLISELGMAVSQLALGIYFHSLAQILDGAAPPPLLALPPLAVGQTALPPLAVGQTALPHLIEGAAASLFNSTQRQAIRATSWGLSWNLYATKMNFLRK